MLLASGTQLGPYEITAPLGSGGMGEVYRAHDTRLDRIVAIKILPAQFAADPVHKHRFEREAKTISSLNHPHICMLYDIGHQDGMDYLVMECIEGETLAKRLEKGPLPLEQVVKFGMQIANALDKAHRGGIVHRDLKPGNIMLTATGAKLLDFGLAKPTLPLASAVTLTAATRNSPVTEQGTIVGTFQYMSPEQIEGKEVDGRSDIFSLGAVLYEMVTGKRAFEGKSQLSVASAILERDPDPISVAKPMTPPALEHSVKKCLTKLPDERWQSASDLASELKWIAETGLAAGEAGHASTGSTRRERAGWLLAGTFFVLILAGGTAWRRARNRHPQPMYFNTSVPFPASDLALSPDGRTLAMVAYSAQANNYVLWTHEVGSRRVSSLEGTQGASYPFWSPDGKFLGFFADGKLKKVDRLGGQPQVLCDAPNGRGGTWNRDGLILFTPDSLGVGLFRVAAWGGPAVEQTSLDTSRFEESHRWPVFLPDGNHFLYLAANFSGQFGNNAIFVGALDSKEKRLLVGTSANAAYAEPGYLVYLREKTLVAQRFDNRRYILEGEPKTLSEEVVYYPQVDRAVFSVSSGEVLVTQTGTGESLSQLTWFDRSGKPAGTVGAPGWYNNVRISTDGGRIAEDRTDPEGRRIGIWILEPARGTEKRMTFDAALHQTPLWSPDGKQILFSWNRKLGWHIFLMNADGSGSEKEAADFGANSSASAWDWSRDGKYMLVRNGTELWYLSWPERVAKPLFQGKWTVRNAQFSPDGRWMAYASNETGSMEIYVSPFPSGSGKWQISSTGGEEPRWRRDGKELFYLSLEGQMMAVPVTEGPSFQAGSPVALFQAHRRRPIGSQDIFSYDVAADGQKFLIIAKVDEIKAAPLSVLLNWASDGEK